jgi:hypothetical protein
MENKTTFEDFLKETWANSPATDGLYKDQWEDAFDAWLESLDGNEYIEYADAYAQRRVDEVEARLDALYNQPIK